MARQKLTPLQLAQLRVDLRERALYCLFEVADDLHRKLSRTDREESRQIRAAEQAGLTDREIADQLHTSPGAIRKRRTREKRKKLPPTAE